MNIKVGREAVAEASKKLSNWGRWGKEDHIGTLNHVTPQNIVDAAKLIRTGKVFALGMALDATGPQNGLFGGRFNPIHQMLATGTDAAAGRQDWNNLRYADDTLILVTWDEGGGFFDHVAPPAESAVDHEAPGTRVPLIAIGRFARHNVVSHVELEHSSIVRFLEWNFTGTTGQLHNRDAVVNNLGSLLDPATTGIPVPEH